MKPNTVFWKAFVSAGLSILVLISPRLHAQHAGQNCTLLGRWANGSPSRGLRP